MKKFIFMLSILAAPLFASAQADYTITPMDEDSVMASPLSVDAQGVQRGSYDFGMLWVGQTRYTNFVLGAGNFPVRVHGMDVQGRFFDGSTNCPSLLLPGQRCTVRVAYWPRQGGNHFGRLNVWVANDRILIDLYGRARY